MSYSGHYANPIVPLLEVGFRIRITHYVIQILNHRVTSVYY